MNGRGFVPRAAGFILFATLLLLAVVPASASAFFGTHVTTGSSSPNGLSNSAEVYGRAVEHRGVCHFEYGTDTTYSMGSVPCSEEPEREGLNVEAELPNLQVGATYHYRLVATTERGLEAGLDQSFTEAQAPAVPGLPIFSFSPEPSETQAGGHPNIRTGFYFAERTALQFPTTCFCQDPQNITTHLPAGVVGNPHAAPYCSLAQVDTHTCPPDSQVGWIWNILFESYFYSPVFNVEPDPDQAGLLSFEFPFTHSPGYIELSARTGSDYGLDATLKGIEQIVQPEGAELTLWGVPADSSHTNWRQPLGAECGNTYSPQPESEVTGPPCAGGAVSTSPRVPFLDNPTACGETVSSSLEILAYDGGMSQLDGLYPATTGCDQLSFNPSLSAQPTTSATDAPSGLEVDLSVPQEESPNTPSPSEIRALTVKLPAGFSINPNAADGKTACTDAEARLGTPEEARCPETSKVGTVTLNSSALPAPIPGYVYLLEPQPGNRYRILLSANGFATHVKLLGTVTPDPATGQLLTSFPNLPQSPFTDFNIHFFGSERGLLATPTQCGKYAVESTFTPWDSVLPKQSATQFFTLTSGPGGSSCPGASRPFSPSLQASSVNGTAAAHTPFWLELTRSDGDQDLRALTVRTPPGLLATLKGIPYCPDTAIAAAAQPSYSGLQEQANPVCPSASQIGESIAGAGAGNHPVYLPGKVYLAGPYEGAPLSLAVITPAVTGPYDLGNVVVRAALHVNPQTAQITAVSDPLPQILEGIPLRLRSIRINLDRQNFTLNPTNCEPFSVQGEVFGTEGAIAQPLAHYQVANCGTLPFAPKLAIGVSGSTKHNGNPALNAQLTFPQTGTSANLSRVSVTLPHSEFLDNSHIKSPCTRVQFSANQCPPGSLLGFAKAETPLLAKPLEGPVYLRSNGGERKLPDIVAELEGQIDINLVGFVESVHSQLRTTFTTLPDAPVSRFTLDLDGGNKGLLINSVNLCAATEHVNVQMSGQNGKPANQNPVLETPCGKRHKRKARR